MSTLGYIKRWWAIGLWTLFIIVVSFIKLPQGAGEQLLPHADKLVHLSLYFILGFLFSQKNFSKGFGLLWGVVLGGMIEVLQGTLTTYRSADVFDFCCDVLGVFAGLYIYDIVKFLKRFSNKSNFFLF